MLNTYFNKGINNLVLGIGFLGKGNVREILYDKFKKIGFSFPVIVDPSAILSKDIIIGEGTFISKGVIVNTNSYIGKMCIISSNAIIEHDCIIDDFSHISVSSILCGQVKVGKSSFIGANATIIQCIEIPSNKIIPAGMTIR